MVETLSLTLEKSLKKKETLRVLEIKWEWGKFNKQKEVLGSLLVQNDII